MILLLLACAAPPPPPTVRLRLDGAWQSPTGPLPLPRFDPAPPGPFTRTVTIPDAWAAAHTALVAEATGWRIHVSVDGAEVGTDIGGAWTSRVDLTGHLAPGTHTLGLTVEPATETNVVPGAEVRPVNTWTWGLPHAGETALRGHLWLEVGPQARVDRVGARLLEGTPPTLEATAWTTGLPVGTPVTFTVVRDGATVLTAGPATTDATGRARANVAYDGPRWPDPAGSAWLVARVEGDTGTATGAARVGLRSATVDGSTLRVDGQRVYLVAERVFGRDLADRATFGHAVAVALAGGANAIAFHGEIIPTDVLDAADELGLPVVDTPRCDGQMHKQGPPGSDPARKAFAATGDARIVAALARHPSIVLWALEAPTWKGGATMHPTFATAEIPLLDEYHNAPLGDPGLDPIHGAPQSAAFYRELAWQPGETETLGQKLAPTLLAESGTGIGVVLPTITPDRPDVPAQRASLRDAVTAAGLPPLTIGPRPGPATLRVTVTRANAPAAGLPVLVDVPGLPTLGAVTDAAGVALLDVEASGPVRVHTVGGEASVDVSLTPGMWALPRWTPSVTEAALPLP